RKKIAPTSSWRSRTMGPTASLIVLLASVSLNTTDDIARDSVDLVEINHFYDENGRHVFDQTIFYDWCPVQARYNIRAWRLLKSPSQIPSRNWKRGGYDAVWHDGDVLRKVHARAFR